MFILPQDTILGPLEVTDVYDIYDIPRLFMAQSPFGNKYIVLSVEEQPGRLTWLYLPVTDERLRELELRHRTLRTAFTEPESQPLVVTTFPDRAATIDQVSDILASEWLPAENEFLRRFPARTSSDMSDARELAQRRWRDVVQFAVTFPRFSGLAAPLRPLGELLSNFQQTVDTLGAAIMGHTAARGPIPIELLERTQLQVTGTFTSSFGATLSAVTQADLFGTSLVGHSIEQLLNVIASGEKSPDLVELLRQLGPRVANRLRVLLETLHTTTATVAIDWAPPVPDSGGSGFIGRDFVERTLTALTSLEIAEAEVLEVTCHLIGANVRTKTYEILSEGSDRRYSGRISDEALSDVAHATINKRYAGKLRILADINTSTGEERVRYLLTSLRPL